jgi:uncharacterized membrane protein (Fun14 family)
LATPLVGPLSASVRRPEHSTSGMTESLYAVPSAVIALALLCLMAACLEIGHRLGRARANTSTEASREHINGIQSAFLGLLALLLAFTFSLALQRFDSRSEAVVDEANAIGTAFLRADLLPLPLRNEARVAISGYLDVRVQEATLPLPDRESRNKVNEVAAKAQTNIWHIAVRASQLEASSRAPLLFVEAVNQLIDSYGKRSAALNRHVPELVLSLLFVTFLLVGATVGFAAGVGNHRPSIVTYMLIGLMVVLVFIVLDLDRPRRGVIQVNHASLVELQSSLLGELQRTHPLAREGGRK